MSQGTVDYKQLANQYPALFGMYGQDRKPTEKARPALPTPNAALARRLQGAAVGITEPRDQALIQELVDFITTRPVWVEGRLFEGAFVLFLKADAQWRSDNAEEFSAFKVQWWPKMLAPLLRHCWPEISSKNKNDRGSFPEP